MDGHKPLFRHPILANLLLFLISCPSLPIKAHAQLLPIVDEQGGGATPGRMQTYIVQLARPEGAPELLGDQDQLGAWHKSFLPNTALAAGSGEPRLLYSYRHAISGFAARLTPEEVEAMGSMDGFLHAEPDQEYQLDTTYSPKFLGLARSEGAWPASSFGEGVVIGVIDSGVPRNPHPSFLDDGIPSPPDKWKGRCDPAVFAACNNKIIRAMEFIDGTKTYTPVDTGGHGTHVASTAAGNFVRGASVNGLAPGEASGIAPRAHLAIYKVCHPSSCPGADILAAIDQAIGDGVDVITMSIGGGPPAKFYQDIVALGSLAAVLSMNIPAVASAGNAGPASQSLSHGAPWVTTVGASSTDRRTGNINGTQYGIRPAPTVARFSSRGPSLPNGGILKPDVLAPGETILGAAPGNAAGVKSFTFMNGTSMAAPHVAGTIALIKKVHPQWSPAAIHSAIITSASERDLDGNLIVDSADNRTAGIFSTGAGQLNPSGALDPDLVYDLDPNDYIGYLCGLGNTHAQGTRTIIVVSADNRPAGIFSTGAGQLNPSGALDPGLVYDLDPNDYVGYLCGLGYTDAEVTITVRRPIRCSAVRAIHASQLNYPSITVTLGSNTKPQTVQRTVTNVGPANSTYQARISPPSGVTVVVTHPPLSFTRVGERKVFTVTLSTTSSTPGSAPARGKFEWVSITHGHVVTTPIAVIFTPTAPLSATI